MSVLKETLTFTNGVEIPLIGLGVWQMSQEEAEQSVAYALKNGYNHIDTARTYGNEEGVGRGIKKSGVAREEFFLTTKISANSKSYALAKKDIEDSLAALDTPYLDLMIIHAPRPWGQPKSDGLCYDENKEVWRALEEAYEEGTIKAIGVSNFQIDDLENLFESAKVKPMINQIKYHIGSRDEELIQFCQEYDMVVEAYSPIGTGRLLKNEAIEKIAEKYGKSTAQISIRYAFQKGLVVLPKSVHENYISENAEIDFVLSVSDMDYFNRLVIE